MEKTPCEPLVGADIEAFVYCAPNRSFVPCVGLLPGTKEAPAPLAGLPEGFAVQEDNVMAEFNIPPATDGFTFAQSISTAVMAVTKMLPPDHKLKFISATTFKAKDLESPQAQLIGCEPDFNAYTGGEVRLNPPSLDKTRGAGGHVHLGGDFKCPDFVAALFAEAFISVCCGLAPKGGDLRMRWYGQPGIYRPKPYGIEYRTLSGEWAGSPDTAQYVGEMAIRCSTWLTESEPLTIQSAFRQIPWLKVAEYMSLPCDSNKSADLRHSLMTTMTNAGMPL